MDSESHQELEKQVEVIRMELEDYLPKNTRLGLGMTREQDLAFLSLVREKLGPDFDLGELVFPGSWPVGTGCRLIIRHNPPTAIWFRYREANEASEGRREYAWEDFCINIGWDPTSVPAIEISSSDVHHEVKRRAIRKLKGHRK
jgi:hypothetical protein